MGMADAGDIFGGAAELDNGDNFMDQVAGIGANDMGTKDGIGFGISEDFYETIGKVVGTGPTVGGKGEFADTVFDTGFLERFFCLADSRDFWPRIDDAGNCVVIDMPRLARDDFGADDPFILRLMRQHWAGHAVTDCVYARCGRAEMLINLDKATFVGFNACRFQPEPFGLGAAADREEDDIAFQRFGIAALGRFQ